MDSVTTETHPSCNYQVYPMENTDNAASVYDTLLLGCMISEGNSKNEAIKIVNKDNVENCWKAPPQSVYSCTATESTDTFT
eukprot:4271309-Ditylum_brightwellii.AAC.1